MWEDSIQKEWDSMRENGVWGTVQTPMIENVLGQSGFLTRNVMRMKI